MRSLILFLSIAGLFITSSFSSELDHQYLPSEEVILWINRIGPYANPSITYNYYHLPFCKPDEEHNKILKSADIGEIIQGNNMVQSGLHVYFKVDVPKTTICQQELTPEQSEKFLNAIKNQYWYQYYLDGLPIWGMVGKHEIDNYNINKEVDYIFTHKKIDISFNEDRIIEVNLTNEIPIGVLPGVKLTFSYSVAWHKTDTAFEHRFQRYLDYNFFEHQIHWFAIFNSIMMVLFLIGLVSLILLRTIRNDFIRYREVDALASANLQSADGFQVHDSFDDESGWKQVHGDVFRAPRYLPFYCALYGIGMQLFWVILLLVLSAIAFKLFVAPNEMLQLSVVLYSLSCLLSGYQSSKLYIEYNYPRKVENNPYWVRVLLYTWGLLPVLSLSVVLIVNIMTIGTAANSMIPFEGVLYLTATWMLICLPLTFVGTFVSRQYSYARFRGFPVRVNALPRAIPNQRWFMDHKILIPLIGWLPFASIFIETYFILSSFWNYKFYYVFGFSLLVLMILCAVVACVTVFAVYLLLSNEDYRWQWVSLLGGGSVGIYVYLYCIYYFFAKTNMSGMLQALYYFGYMSIFCVGLALMCGAIGSFTSMIFLKRIYRNIHVD